MLVWILAKMGFSEFRIRSTVEKYTRVKTALSAVFYTIMVFVVVFGISGDVYAGFSKPVPYIIIAIFLFMSFVRMYQFLLDDGYIGRTVEKTLSERKKKMTPHSAGAPSPEASAGTAGPAARESVTDEADYSAGDNAIFEEDAPENENQ